MKFSFRRALRPLTWAALPVFLLLAACTNSGRLNNDGRLQEELEISLLANTSKMFVYRLGRQQGPEMARIALPEDSGRQRARGGPGMRLDRNTAQRLEANALAAVTASGYCKEGFLLLDRSISPQYMWLKGECREGADAADSARFGNVKTLDSALWLQAK